jgi:hypothetical protein
MSDNDERARKNRTETENYYIKQEVQLQVQAGYPLKQAQAIAFRKFRDGELFIPNIQTDTPASVKKQRQAMTNNALDGLYLLFKLGSLAYEKMTEDNKK